MAVAVVVVIVVVVAVNVVVVQSLFHVSPLSFFKSFSLKVPFCSIF